MSIGETIGEAEAIHRCHPEHSLVYLWEEWQNGSRSGVKRKILTNLLFMGRGFSFQAFFIEAFLNTSPSLSALTSANQRAWVQDFFFFGGGEDWRISETIANESAVMEA